MAIWNSFLNRAFPRALTWNNRAQGLPGLPGCARDRKYPQGIPMIDQDVPLSAPHHPLYHGPHQLRGPVVGPAERGFELIAEGHELVDLGYDALLLLIGRQR